MHDHAISATALYIAEGLSILAQDLRIAPLIPAPDRRLAQEARRIGSSDHWRRFLETKVGQKLYTTICQHLSPGVWLHHVLRKRIIDQKVREALSDGFETVIVLAAGFDALAYRLHRDYPQVSFIEVDLARTQAAKRRCLESPGANLHFLAADLSETRLLDLLTQVPHDASTAPKTKTMVIVEGLSMYLTEDEIKGLLGGIAALPDLEVRLIMTFFKPNSRGEIAFETNTPLGKAWLALKREPYKWGIGESQLPAFLLGLGFACQGIWSTAEAAHDFGLGGLTLAQGELIAMADRTAIPATPSTLKANSGDASCV